MFMISTQNVLYFYCNANLVDFFFFILWWLVLWFVETLLNEGDAMWSLRTYKLI